MDFVGSILMPGALVLFGVAMGALEIRNFRHPRGQPASFVVRLVRRLVGCASIVTIGVLIYQWLGVIRPALLAHPGGPAPVTFLSVLSGMVLFIVALGIWDAIDGLRGLRNTVDQMQRDDMKELNELIRQAKEKGLN